MRPLLAIMALSLVMVVTLQAGAQDVMTGKQLKESLNCDRPTQSVMPPFTLNFSRLNEASYRIEFLTDNYPGNRIGDEIYAHPIYATYVLGDYISMHQSAQDDYVRDIYRNAIYNVSKAAICRMETLRNGGLAFYYDYPYISPGQTRFYSALTQAQYLYIVHQAGMISGDPSIIAAAEMILRSLELLDSEGGVVFIDPRGRPIPQEYPGDATHPPQFVLNGWLDTLIGLDAYRSVSGSAKAGELVDRFSVALQETIEKFDSPKIANSLYKLSEIAQINLSDVAGGEIEIVKAKVVIPGLGTYPIVFSEKFEDKAYKNIFHGPSSSLVNGVLRLSNNANAWLWLSLFPAEGNIIELEVKATRSSLFQFRLLTGQPIMRGGGKTNLEWLPLTPPTRLTVGNTMKLRITVPPEKILEATQPTTYFKPIMVDGKTKYVNVYHYSHVSQLCRLSSTLGISRFRNLAITWEKYIDKWAGMTIYKDSDIDLRRSDIVLGFQGNSYSCREKD